MVDLLQLAVAILIPFGGLFIWPVYRLASGGSSHLDKLLRIVFWGHLVGAVGSWLFVAYCKKYYPTDWLMSLYVPHFVGFLSITLSVVFFLHQLNKR